MALKKKKTKTSKAKATKAKAVKKPRTRKLPLKKKMLKKATRKAPKKTGAKKAAAPKIKEDVVGRISHYFPHVMAGVIKLKKPLSVGEQIRIKGHTTDFIQKIASMQIDRTPIQAARKGDEIGVLVESRVRRGDKVVRVKV